MIPNDGAMPQVVIYEGALDPASIGGARYHFLGLASALARREDVRLILITPKYTGSPEWPQVAGAEHVKLSVGRKSVLALLIYEFRKAYVLARLRRTVGAGSIFLTRLGLANWSTVVARKLGYRVLLEVNGLPSDELRDRGFGRLVRSAVAVFGAAQYRAASGMIAVTEGIAQRIRSVTRERVLVLPNGSDAPDQKGREPASTTISSVDRGTTDSPLLVYVGVLAPWQDLGLSLRALRRLRDESGVKWRLAVVGDGEGRDEFLRTVNDLNLQEAVQWLGWQPQSQICYILEAANAGLVPLRSKGESGLCGSPLKLFEYLASGLPVVASGVDGVRELTYPSLFIYPEGDLDGLVEACRRAAATTRATGTDLRALQQAVSWDCRAEELFIEHMSDHARMRRS